MKITPKHRQAAELLASGVSKTEAAKRLGFNRHRFYVWLQTEEFRQLLEAAHQRKRIGDEDWLASLMYRTTEVLQGDLQDSNPRLRVRVARRLHDMYEKSFQQVMENGGNGRKTADELIAEAYERTTRKGGPGR